MSLSETLAESVGSSDQLEPPRTPGGQNQSPQIPHHIGPLKSHQEVVRCYFFCHFQFPQASFLLPLVKEGVEQVLTWLPAGSEPGKAHFRPQP